MQLHSPTLHVPWPLHWLGSHWHSAEPPSTCDWEEEQVEHTKPELHWHLPVMHLPCSQSAST